jgi:hypothetical protein
MNEEMIKIDLNDDNMLKTNLKVPGEARTAFVYSCIFYGIIQIFNYVF